MRLYSFSDIIPEFKEKQTEHENEHGHTQWLHGFLL